MSVVVKLSGKLLPTCKFSTNYRAVYFPFYAMVRLRSSLINSRGVTREDRLGDYAIQIVRRK